MATLAHPQRDGLGMQARLDRVLERCVDAGLAAAVFAVPLVLGGRMALGQLILVGAVLWIAVCWCARQSLDARAAWTRSAAEPILVAALVWVGLQLPPLPTSVGRAVSGKAHELLPLWGPPAGQRATLGEWTTLSLCPASTQAGLVVLAAFVLLFLFTVQRVGRIEDVERLIRWIAWAAVAVAALGLVQYFLGNGRYFGFYRHPRSAIESQLVGSFTNRNHFAHFMALGVGPLLWWVFSGLKRGGDPAGATPRFHTRNAPREVNVALRAIALGLVVFAGLVSLSRGGAVAIVVALAAGTGVLYTGSVISRKTLIALAASGAAVGAGLLAYGYESLAGRLSSFQSIESLDVLRLRRDLWAADLEAVADFPLTGTGLATHARVFPIYLPNTWCSQKVDFTHAESGYVQVAMETGIPGLLLVLAAVGLCAYWCVCAIRRAAAGTSASPRALLCLVAIVPALLASMVHALIDFVWYVPGLMVVVVILGACACRLWQGVVRGDCPGKGDRHILPAETARKMSQSPARPVPRAAWLGAAAMLLVVGFFMAQNRFAATCAEPSWNRYLLLSETLPDLEVQQRPAALREIAKALSAVVRWEPDHAAAHLELAEVHRELFSASADPDVCPLDVRQVREAALASRFASSQAMYAWLGRAFGPRCRHLQAVWHHAREAISLCPLLGRAYLCLADVSFLEGPGAPSKAAYVEQAVRVRPLDGDVLFAAGQEAMLAGDHELALDYWRASFRCGKRHQERLLAALGDRVPGDALLRTFEPDWAAMQVVRDHYLARGQSEKTWVMWQFYAKAARRHAESLSGSSAAAIWLAAARAHEKTGERQQRIECLRRAVRCDPSNYEAHRALGLDLLAAESFEAAGRHLTWCLHCRPDDEHVRAKVEALADRRQRLSRRSIPRR
jgi:O-antigen ligase/tetratricopeptide (TPR) repeat protein